MKTRKEHLRILPAEIIAEVKAIMEIEGTGFRLDWVCNKNNTLLEAMVFSDTKQGHAYWWAINEQYFKN